jgi:hypothetical protein
MTLCILEEHHLYCTLPCKLSEILGSLWADVGEELHHSSSHLCRTDFYIHKYNRIVGMPELRLDLGPAVNCCHFAVSGLL